MAVDPFRSAWRIWAIVVVLLILLPTACALTMAQATRADGPPLPEDVRCHKGWCLVRQDTLQKIVTNLQKLDQHARDLRALCGWKDK